ncbi:hypothetical protein ABNE62_23000, partial [Paenibacillus larvae]
MVSQIIRRFPEYPSKVRRMRPLAPRCGYFQKNSILLLISTTRPISAQLITFTWVGVNTSYGSIFSIPYSS